MVFLMFNLVVFFLEWNSMRTEVTWNSIPLLPKLKLTYQNKEKLKNPLLSKNKILKNYGQMSR